VASQGISISLIASPSGWLIGTAVFLAFGAGFYVLNLLEIRRKQKVAGISLPFGFVDWQRRRMIELFAISLMALAGAYLVNVYSAIVFPAALISLGIAVWQLSVTRAYRTHQFINTGI